MGVLSVIGAQIVIGRAVNNVRTLIAKITSTYARKDALIRFMARTAIKDVMKRALIRLAMMTKAIAHMDASLGNMAIGVNMDAKRNASMGVVTERPDTVPSVKRTPLVTNVHMLVCCR